jgi:hypothetical protein
MKIAAAIHDMMFSSKVNAAAKGNGQTVAWLPRGTPIAAWVTEQKPDVLLIDLGAVKNDPRRPRASSSSATSGTSKKTPSRRRKRPAAIACFRRERFQTSCPSC